MRIKLLLGITTFQRTPRCQSGRSRGRRCEAPALRCRPRAGGAHTPQQGDVARPAISLNLGGYWSPPARRAVRGKSGIAEFHLVGGEFELSSGWIVGWRLVDFGERTTQ